MISPETEKKSISGEELVFEQLFSSQFRNLYVYAFNMVKEEAAAKETVQQVFFRLWRKKELLEKFGLYSLWHSTR